MPDQPETIATRATIAGFELSIEHLGNGKGWAQLWDTKLGNDSPVLLFDLRMWTTVIDAVRNNLLPVCAYLPDEAQADVPEGGIALIWTALDQTHDELGTLVFTAAEWAAFTDHIRRTPEELNRPVTNLTPTPAPPRVDGTPIVDAMYERAYLEIQNALDTALGSKVEDGAGRGIVADVLLVIQRYNDLRRVVLAGRAWSGIVRQIEAADLRDAGAEPPTWAEDPYGGGWRDDATGLISGGLVTD